MPKSNDSKKLFVVEDKIIVSRNNCKYIYSSSDFSRKIEKSANADLKVINNRLYEFTENTITNKSGETREYSFGGILDFHRFESKFYFVRSKINKKIIVDENGKEILEFTGIYTFNNSSFYFIEDNSLLKYSFQKLEKTIIETSKTTLRNVSILECRSEDIEGDLVVMADRSNIIHVYNCGTYSAYAWHSHPILAMKLLDDFVVSVSKNGVIVRMNVRREEKRLLFESVGHYIDMVLDCNRVYYLSSLEFIAYDIGTENIIHKEIIPSRCNFKLVKLTDEKTEDEDIFRLKRSSKTEIASIFDNSFESKIPAISYGKEANTNEYIVLNKLSSIFLVSPNTLEIKAQFHLPSTINYISENFVINLTIRKSMMIINIYKIYEKKLVLEQTKNIQKKTIAKMFYFNEKLYILSDSDLLLYNESGIPDIIYSNPSPFTIIQKHNFIIIDEKGIFDIKSKSYIIKQKKVLGAVFIDSKPIINIEGKGLYIEDGEKIQILESINIIDFVVEGDNLKILRTGESSTVFSIYKIINNELTLLSERNLEISCSSIIHKDTLLTSSGEIIVL